MVRQEFGFAAMRVLGIEGVAFLQGLSDDEASAVSRHWNAVRHYLDTGDDSELGEFADVEVVGIDETDSPRRVRLEADPDAIEAHALRGDISFESIYDEVQ